MNFLDKYRPFYSPDVDTGVDTDAGNTAPPAVPMNEAPVDGPGSGRSELRKQLEKNTEASRKSSESKDRNERRQPQRSRARQEMETQAAEPDQELGQEQVEDTESEGQEQDQQSAGKAPEGWSKDAKAVWEQLPQPVQAAVAKRETDMARGVEELKKKYSDIDQVLAPRLEVIRKHGHTPAAAVNQLFAWFEALGSQPDMAFPALAQSFKYDLRRIPGLFEAVAQQLQAQGQQQPAPQAAPSGQPGADQGDIPPTVKSYISGLEQKLSQLEQGVGQRLSHLTQTQQARDEARMHEFLNHWSKDKPYYDDVRLTMAHLIQSGAVAPLPDNSADLDRAYDMAVWAVPEVRSRIQADQQAQADAQRKAKADAERKAQQEEANRARRANAGMLSQGAPGNPGSPQNSKKRGKSVRESILEAREELL